MARQLTPFPALPPHISLRTFPTAEALASALAETLAARLAQAVEGEGAAAIALSGGETPRRMLLALARTPIEWTKVYVTLVDERFVAASEPRSNARLLGETLLAGPAGVARFTPFVTSGDIGNAAAETSARVAALPLPFAAVVLGMGNDGHTASFFPLGNGLGAALDAAGERLVVPVAAPGAPEPRLTLTLPPILAAGLLVLHIEGDAKRETLARALGDGPVEDMPVRAVLRAGRPLEIFWAP